MATLLDAQMVGIIYPILTFIFILALSYAIMDKFTLLGGNKAIHVLISFCVAFLFLFSKTAIGIVGVLTPWFVVMVVIALFVVSFFLFIGISESDMAKVVKKPEVYWPILLIIIIFLFVSIAQVFKATNLADDTTQELGESPTTEGIGAIVNPKVLGAIVLLIIAALSINFISSDLKPGT